MGFPSVRSATFGMLCRAFLHGAAAMARLNGFATDMMRSRLELPWTRNCHGGNVIDELIESCVPGCSGAVASVFFLTSCAKLMYTSTRHGTIVTLGFSNSTWLQSR